MSGYLEVKYPFKSNLGLYPFKSWKRQWCILRPSPTRSGGCLAVYCSEAGAATGVIDLLAGSIVRRAKSRSKPYAFAVFGIDDRKPTVLLAAHSLVDAQTWMEKIRALLSAEQILGPESLLKDSFPITFIPTDLALNLGLNGSGTLTVSSNGLQIIRELTTFVEWKYIFELSVASEEKERICVVKINSDHNSGGGELKLGTPLAEQICSASRARRGVGMTDKLSRSDTDLRSTKTDSEERRTSWYSGPSEVSLDDIDLIMSKESQHIPCGQLYRYSGEGHLAAARPRLQSCTVPSTTADDSMCDRRSLASVASGIYEEIPDLPDHDTSNTYCTMSHSGAAQLPTDKGIASPYHTLSFTRRVEEPTYESVSECVFATMRRVPRTAPPLPPRTALGSKMGESWNSRLNKADGNATRHSSLNSIPRCYSTSSSGRSLPAKQNTFSVFRKRLKSDSRITTSPKSETSKENKDVETKKKKFDFAPTRDIFKNFKVSKKMKNLKITSNLTKGETKSCEFLDETEHVSTKRCSKSVECLEDSNEFLDDEVDLSIDFNDDAVSALALPQEIVDLILRGREQMDKIRLKDTEVESDYMPMSPIIPTAPMEHHYIVMSPKTNLA